MMICRADFEELFPETFRPTPKSDSGQSRTEECLARWEKDGGRPSVRARVFAERPPNRLDQLSAERRHGNGNDQYGCSHGDEKCGRPQSPRRPAGCCHVG